MGPRSKPIATSTNPTGYTERRNIVKANGEDAILGADDVFYYLHDPRRLYTLQSQLQYQKAYNICFQPQHQREMEYYYGISPSNIFLEQPTMTS